MWARSSDRSSFGVELKIEIPDLNWSCNSEFGWCAYHQILLRGNAHPAASPPESISGVSSGERPRHLRSLEGGKDRGISTASRGGKTTASLQFRGGERPRHLRSFEGGKDRCGHSLEVEVSKRLERGECRGERRGAGGTEPVEPARRRKRGREATGSGERGEGRRSILQNTDQGRSWVRLQRSLPCRVLDWRGNPPETMSSDARK
jgi:hypothetical protein